MSDPMDAIRQSFFEECDELLEELELGLLALQDGSADEETIGAVFRAVHSIKGGAGAFALDPLTRFAHDFETVLDLVRSDALSVDPDLALVLLRSADVLADIAHACASGDSHDESAAEALRKELKAKAAMADDASPSLNLPDIPDVAEFAPIAVDLDDDGPAELPSLGYIDETSEIVDDADTRTLIWDIRFEPIAGLLASGNEPLFLFRSLAVLGQIQVTCDTVGLPDLDTIPADELVIAWQIRLTPASSDLTKTEIEAVFDFAEGLCHLTIEGIASAPDTKEIDALDSDPVPEDPATSAIESKAAVPSKASSPKPPATKSSAPKVNASEQRGKPQSSSVRVDLHRIDDLVNLVGEIVIAQAMLSQITSEPGRQQEVATTIDTLTQLTLEVQDSVMAIRALPVRPLFQRMSRIVREAAQMTGKEVKLITEGEDTQIDKTVIELLADPLTHMVRNAVDHGLEEAHVRSSAGKSRQGTVRLAAAQRSDRVFVEISDDGAGIDREKVLKKARSLGLVDADASPEPGEIDRLLFLPGFSTSDQVSELSGRGVGMDVVNRAIQNLSGTISITSEPGAGTKLTVSLPLTLAILDGMVLVSGDDRYVMPLAAIVETMTCAGADIQGVSGGGHLVRAQGKYVPLYDLSALLGQSHSKAPLADRTILLVDSGDSNPFALLIDDIEAQRQVVVKGLTDATGSVPGISAATILGNGRIALILDGSGLRNLAQNAEARKFERLAS